MDEVTFGAWMARIGHGAVEPYEGAFEVARRLQKAPPSGGWHDPRRLIFRHFAEWWETRPELRSRVEAEILEFARIWTTEGGSGIRARSVHWNRWYDPYGMPLADAGPLVDPSGIRWMKRKPVDLRRIRNTARIRNLYLDRCRFVSFDGIERLPSLRDLRLYQVKSLGDLRAIERVRDLHTFVIHTDDPDMARAVAAVDFGAFPCLRELILDVRGIDPRTPVALDTAWVPQARWLRYLALEGFVPAGGDFDDLRAAPGLINLQITPFTDDDHSELSAALPLTQVGTHFMPPLVDHDPNAFGMFSDEGNLAVAAVVDEIRGLLADPATRPRLRQLNAILYDRMTAIEDAGHREVSDSHVRDLIAAALMPAMEDAGLDSDGLQLM
jgi:hypothetical protein